VKQVKSSHQVQSQTKNQLAIRIFGTGLIQPVGRALVFVTGEFGADADAKLGFLEFAVATITANGPEPRAVIASTSLA